MEGGWEMCGILLQEAGSVCVQSEGRAMDRCCLTWTQRWTAPAADFCWVMNFLLKQDVGEESSGWLNHHRLISLKQFSLLYLFSSHQSQACSVPQQLPNRTAPVFVFCAPSVVFQAVLPDTINQTFDLEQDDCLSKVFIYG